MPADTSSPTPRSARTSLQLIALASCAVAVGVIQQRDGWIALVPFLVLLATQLTLLLVAFLENRFPGTAQPIQLRRRSQPFHLDAAGLLLMLLATTLASAIGLPEAYYRMGSWPDPVHTLAILVIFDALAYGAHWLSHRRGLLGRLHAGHHHVLTPNVPDAAAGGGGDILSLLGVPFFVAVWCVPQAEFASGLLAAVIFSFVTAAAHANREWPWDPLLRTIGVVTPPYHHVHHLRPRANLAHVLVILDKLGGTQLDVVPRNPWQLSCNGSKPLTRISRHAGRKSARSALHLSNDMSRPIASRCPARSASGSATQGTTA